MWPLCICVQVSSLDGSFKGQFKRKPQSQRYDAWISACWSTYYRPIAMFPRQRQSNLATQHIHCNSWIPILPDLLSVAIPPIGAYSRFSKLIYDLSYFFFFFRVVIAAVYYLYNSNVEVLMKMTHKRNGIIKKNAKEKTRVFQSFRPEKNIKKTTLWTSFIKERESEIQTKIFWFLFKKKRHHIPANAPFLVRLPPP